MNGVLRLRHVRAAGALLVAFGALLAASCQSPTQMRMVLRTDMACDTASGAAYTLNDLSIYVARDDATLQQRMRDGTPAAYMSSCTRGAGGELGTLYLTPDGSDTAIVAVMAGLVHTGAGTSTRQSAQTCTSAVQENCLLSTRRFRYSTHQTGVVPVLLEASCVNHRPECAPGETCRGGVCTSDVVDPVEGAKDAGAADVVLDSGFDGAGDGAPAPTFTCAGGQPVYTAGALTDPSCSDPANPFKCVVRTAGGSSIVCRASNTVGCVQICCSGGFTGQCCVRDGFPVPDANCGRDPIACFSESECSGCRGKFDPSVGFGGCAAR
ncbi:MAG: hypothetical protein HOO96_16150 [Polyangiaceae bacterium]|nr:hypothetical protein [Polyangiaceae bacterium]